jgi:FkbM family methyltransferase
MDRRRDGMMRTSTKGLVKALYAAAPFKLPLFRLIRPLRPPHRLYQHLHFEGDFTVRIAGDAGFRLHSHGDQVENQLFWTGFGGAFDAVSQRVWEKLARSASGAVLDIGANTGVYALTAKALNPALQVVAFEPLARVMRKLRRNIALNGFAIETIEKAVSDRSGTATIHDSADPDAESNAYSASLETGFDANKLSYEIETLALDDWMTAERPRVDLIKLDVELHEPAAIRGMKSLLADCRPAILIEVLNPGIGAEVAALVKDLDYRFFAIDENDGLHPVEALGPRGAENRNNLLCSAEQFARAGLADLLAPGSDER